MADGAYLAEQPLFVAQVYEIATTDPVEGGPNGVDNRPHRELANRTLYLKQHVDALESGATPAGKASRLATARTLSLSGDASWSVAFDGSANASGALVLANTGVVAGSYRSLTVDAKGRVTGGSNPTTLAGYGITDALLASEVVAASTANKVLRLNASGELPTSITGNANTATALATARSLSATGDASWTVSFNGSANATAALTLSPSGVTAGTYRSLTVDAKGRVTGGSNPTTLAGYGITDAVQASEVVDVATASKLLRLNSSGALPASVTGNANTATALATARSLSATGDASWSVSFNGSANASGALVLANTGVAAGTYRNLTVDAKGRVTGGSNPTTLAGFGITDALLASEVVAAAAANKVLRLNANGDLPADITGTAATADRWTTARTLSLVGGAQGSATIDGAGNVSLSVTVADDSHAHLIANIDGLQAQLDSKIASSTLSTQDLDTVIAPGFYAQPATANATLARHYPEALAGSLIVTAGADYQQRYHVYNTQRVYVRAKYATGAWTAWALVYNTANKPSAADVGALPAAGNAASASKWQTARTLTLTGDASGSVAIDGAGNISLAVTVADDSHAHLIGNIDGLQAALDTKLSLADFPNSLTENGWQKLPGGLILQFGRVTEASSATDYRYFPLAFPTTCVGVLFSLDDATTQGFSGSWGTIVKIVDKTKFLWDAGGTWGGGGIGYFIAIGW